MARVPVNKVEKILLELPNSSKVPEFSNSSKTVFKIESIIVVIPSEGININHLQDILESQLGMSWWMIDYLFGQNGIR